MPPKSKKSNKEQRDPSLVDHSRENPKGGRPTIAQIEKQKASQQKAASALSKFLTSSKACNRRK